MRASRVYRGLSVLAGLLFAAVPAVRAGVLTPLGTQSVPNFEMLPPSDCSGCHGGYDGTNHIEPWDTWAGSMMANASRDPIFWAALDVANHDGEQLDPPVYGIGEYCLRCHSSAGWLAGRANSNHPAADPGDADGCSLEGQIDQEGFDFTGISCHLCHRMMVNPSPPPGQDSVYFENGNFWLDDEDCPDGSGPCRRGPYTYPGPNGDQEPPGNHSWAFSPYHVDNRICGNCHNVSNPILELVDATGTPLPGISFPIERTFKEWQQSDFSDDQSASFANCSDCHMPDSDADPVYASIQGQNNRALPDSRLPVHQFAGGNSWIPQVLEEEYPDLGRAALFDATTAWAEDLLINRSATVEIAAGPAVGDGDELPVMVTVTNLTGHKLPTGYGEGRRMWLQIEARDALNTLIWQSGDWDPASGVLTADPQLKVYEVQQGIWNYNLTGSCDVEDDATGGHLFHFVRNNCIALDNRIPPLGFRPETAPGVPDPETVPVNYNYPETTPGSGELVNYDRTSYLIPIPPGTLSPITVEARLVYQTSSKEYIEFLRDQAVDNAFPDDCLVRDIPLDPGTSRGEYLYELWTETGRSAPVPMGTAVTGSITVVDIFADGFESGDTSAWSSAVE